MRMIRVSLALAAVHVALALTPGWWTTLEISRFVPPSETNYAAINSGTDGVTFPGPRAATGAAQIGSSMFIYGGQGPNTNVISGPNPFGKFLAELWEYNPAAGGVWTQRHGPGAGAASSLPPVYTGPAGSITPGGRFRHALLATPSGNLYVAFGDGGGAGLLRNDIFLWNSPNWIVVRDGTPAANYAAAIANYGVNTASFIPNKRYWSLNCATNSFLYFFGGYNYAGPTGPFNDFVRYDLTNNQWALLSGDGNYNNAGSSFPTDQSYGHTPGARFSGSMTISSTGQIYMHGGTTASVNFDQLWQWDTTIAAGAPNWRLLYGHAGTTAATYTSSSAFGIYHSSNNPGSRLSHELFLNIAQDKLIIFHGYGNNQAAGYPNSMWAYDLGLGQWAKIDGTSFTIDDVAESNLFPVEGAEGVEANIVDPGAGEDSSSFYDPTTGDLMLFHGNMGHAPDAASATSPYYYQPNNGYFWNSVWRYHLEDASCAPGYYPSGGCQQCPSGSWCAGGLAAPVACVANRHTVPNLGADDITDCVCNDFWSGPAGGSACTHCVVPDSFASVFFDNTNSHIAGNQITFNVQLPYWATSTVIDFPNTCVADTVVSAWTADPANDNVAACRKGWTKSVAWDGAAGFHDTCDPQRDNTNAVDLIFRSTFTAKYDIFSGDYIRVTPGGPPTPVDTHASQDVNWEIHFPKHATVQTFALRVFSLYDLDAAVQDTKLIRGTVDGSVSGTFQLHTAIQYPYKADTPSVTAWPTGLTVTAPATFTAPGACPASSAVGAPLCSEDFDFTIVPSGGTPACMLNGDYTIRFSLICSENSGTDCDLVGGEYADVSFKLASANFCGIISQTADISASKTSFNGATPKTSFTFGQSITLNTALTSTSVTITNCAVKDVSITSPSLVDLYINHVITAAGTLAALTNAATSGAVCSTTFTALDTQIIVAADSYTDIVVSITVDATYLSTSGALVVKTMAIDVPLKDKLRTLGGGVQTVVAEHNFQIAGPESGGASESMSILTIVLAVVGVAVGLAVIGAVVYVARARVGKTPAGLPKSAAIELPAASDAVPMQVEESTA